MTEARKAPRYLGRLVGESRHVNVQRVEPLGTGGPDQLFLLYLEVGGEPPYLLERLTHRGRTYLVAGTVDATDCLHPTAVALLLKP